MIHDPVDQRVLDKDIYDLLGSKKTIQSLIRFILGGPATTAFKNQVLEQYLKAIHSKKNMNVMALFVIVRVIRNHSLYIELFESDLTFMQYVSTEYKEEGFLVKSEKNIRFLSFLYNHYSEQAIVFFLQKRVKDVHEWNNTIALFEMNMYPFIEYEFDSFFKPPRVLDTLTLQFEFGLCLHSIERGETEDYILEYPQDMKVTCEIWEEYEIIMLPQSTAKIQEWMRALYFDNSGIMDEVIDNKAIFYGVKWKEKLLYMISIDHFDGMVLQGVFGKYPPSKTEESIRRWYQCYEKTIETFTSLETSWEKSNE